MNAWLRLQFLTSCMVGLSSSSVLACKEPAGGSHVLHMGRGATCCAKRGQTLWWEARG